MDPARWELIESICFEALEHDAAARQAFVDAACAGDSELGAEVLGMLRQLQDDPGFLERPLVDLRTLEEGETERASAPSTIGAYRLVRPLGRGGMGEVYLAERQVEDVRQKVAIKVIRPPRAGTELLRRFGLERRILATLSHPNIATFLDASITPEGRPYFVMEYVDGVPVDEYCDRRRLSVRERLKLFLVICRAVQHAHQNLIVHRDLKPRNILVTTDGVPKLLDFGIGKVLADDAAPPSDETQAADRLMTPDYAAPEQIGGGAVTTATDTYGLGVLLYVLLTGCHPHLRAARSGLAGTRATELLLPSAAVRRSTGDQTDHAATFRSTDHRHLGRELSGDLDTIVWKALREEPERRYPSASALADDIERHLDGLPVSARPDTLLYRTRKFARRNAGWVAAAGVAVLALSAMTGVTLVQSRRVEREAQRAAEERDKALEVRSFLMEMFGASGADRLAGDTLTVRRLLDLQSESLESTYGDRPELKAEMMEVLADGYDRIGLLQEAEPLAREALELRRASLPVGHPDVASSLNTYGWVLHQLGRTVEAEPLLVEAVAVRRAAGERQRQHLARALNDLGVILTALRRYDEAEGMLGEALEIRRAEAGDGHRSVGITASNLAAVHYQEGRLEEAVRVQTLALQALQEAVGDEHQRSIIALSNLAAFKAAGGQWDAAIHDYRELTARQTTLQGRGHLVTTRVLNGLAITLYQRGTQLQDSAKIAEAEGLFRETVENYRALVGESDARVGVQLARVAAAAASLGRLEDALGTAERALMLVRTAAGDTHQNTAFALATLAQVRARTGAIDDALALQRQALAVYESALGSVSAETATARAALCELLVMRGDMEEALPSCVQAERTLLETVPPARARQSLPMIQLQLAKAHLARGARRAADSLVAEARRGVESVSENVQARRSLDSLTTRMAGP